MQPRKPDSADAAFLDQCVREMVEGLTEAIDREVERRRRKGLPIHVCQNGQVIDLQQVAQGS